ncbi:THO complex subunit 2 [Metschnikowia aff. pulcherrima]|uniref:THO complex subunit 2 n=1 Tax=Metschnikowia aff. pulcherrima TaxID=2163413 RepID=A0A4P6XN32_9ASCO|nr:THO complex subunit 2 [Metschnikowia aff. pulcherrima]
MADQDTGLYEYLTPAIVADFQGTGMPALLETLQTPELLDVKACEITSLIFTEILMLVQTQELTLGQAVEFMKLAITDERKAIVLCQVFDVFPSDSTVEALITRLHKDEHVLNASTLALHVDSDTLVKIGIVPAANLNRQMNTRKRDEYFTQKKFNLFHEEYEGFSILLNEFHSFFGNEENEFLVDHAVNVVYSLIGHYMLDPNRVLDVLIDICANYVVGNHHFIVGFFKKSPWWPQAEGSCNAGFSNLSAGGNPAVVSLIALRLVKQAPDRELSETFKILITLFIKEGLISFGLIYPFFSPSNSEMEKLEALYQKELEEKVSRASASSLALAAPLSEEDTEENGDVKVADVSAPKKTVASLLSHNMRFQMLKCFLGNGLYWPSIYILSQYPFLAHLDHDVSALMHRVLSAIIDPFHRKLSRFTEKELAVFQKSKPTTVPRTMNLVSHEESMASHLYCFKPTTKSHGNRSFTYFYSEWSRGLPALNSAHDLIIVSQQFLKFFGPSLAENTTNFIKLCEIVVAILREDNSDEQKEVWFTYFRNYLLPSVGFIKENPIPVDKAYEILSYFSVDDRFNLYGELHQVMAKSNPFVKIAYGKAEKATKDVLKRLSKENVEPMMRRLAKISLSNPLPCFLAILQQLESYDNLNTLVVDTAAYFNDYGWDNLTLAIMMRLSATGRSNRQANGLNERQWIQSLSKFVGKICQRYPQSIDLDTLIRFLVLSFHMNGNVDLIVLKKILGSMGGIQAITNLTQLQIEMVNCGPSMQKIVYETIGDKRYEYRQSGTTLRDSLVKGGAVNELLILLCKINKDTLDSSAASHPKVMTTIRDEVDSVLHLLCTLLEFFGTDVSTLLPIDELIRGYNVPIAWAFEVWRRQLPIIGNDVVQSQILKALPSGYMRLLNLNLFVMFWQLSLYDLNYSSALYDSELAKLQSRVVNLKEEYSFARRDRSVLATTTEKLKSSISKTEFLASTIPPQKADHEKKSHEVDNYLIAQLTDLSAFGDTEAKDFVQLCILPRALHSSIDAVYSAQFVFKLHKLGIRSYNIAEILEALFESQLFFATLFTCTPTEAENLGVFVSAIFKELNSWTNEEVFKSHTRDAGIRKGDSDIEIDIHAFRKMVFKFHTLLLDDVSRALRVTNYMSRMNAITYLKNLLGVYPIVEDHCESIIEAIESIAREEKRDDLKLSSSALIGHVKSRKASWLHLWDFIEMDETAKAEHMQKRQKIEEREEALRKRDQEKKMEAQRLEEAKYREEEQKKQSERKAELIKDSSLKAISYDEKAQPSSRAASSRNVEVVKGRYDSYSLGLPAAQSVSEKAVEEKPVKRGLDSAPLEKDQRGPPPSGPSGSKSRQDTPESAEGSMTSNKRDVGSGDDLFRNKASSKDFGVSAAPARNPELKARLESARRELNAKSNITDRGDPSARRELNAKSNISDRGDPSVRSNEQPESSRNTLRSNTPVAPGQIHTAPSSSSSGRSGPRSKAEIRVPLPPQSVIKKIDSKPELANEKNQTERVPTPVRDGRSDRKTESRQPLPPQAVPRKVPTAPSASLKEPRKDGRRTPLSPQVPPREVNSSASATSRARQSLPPQLSVVAAVHAPAQQPAKNRVPLPPQQPPREGRTNSPHLGSRGNRSSANAGGRDQVGRQEGRGRRPSGEPLPPPSLPPPGRMENKDDLRKRRYGDGRRDAGKRLRY